MVDSKPMLIVREGGWCNPQPRPNRGGACCLIPQGPPPERPDLATYSQEEQFSLGVAPTWDSPDILTNFWNPFRLMPESQVTVRNLSTVATAVNGQVLFYTATFGIGQPRTLLGSQYLTLAPGASITLTFPLPQQILQAAEQRIAVHCRIVHPADGKAINNFGSQLLADSYTTKVGRAFSAQFPVVNPLAAPQPITLEPLPNAVGAVVAPDKQIFGPLQQVMVTLSVQVPAGLHGTGANPLRTDVTVVGRGADGKVIDGLTYVIWVDD